MAGYSGTPLPKKLGIKPGSRVAVLRAPSEAANIIDEIGAEAIVATRLSGREPFGVILLFCRTRKDLDTGFSKARERLAENGGLWVAWPKKASGVATDLNEGLIRGVGLAAGLVDNKVCAVDETWSGLRFVVRLKDRSR
jgi:hypothetical protein